MTGGISAALEKGRPKGLEARTCGRPQMVYNYSNEVQSTVVGRPRLARLRSARLRPPREGDSRGGPESVMLFRPDGVREALP